MNVIMISPGYPAEMAFFARGLAAGYPGEIMMTFITDQPSSTRTPVMSPHSASATTAVSGCRTMM